MGGGVRPVRRAGGPAMAPAMATAKIQLTGGGREHMIFRGYCTAGGGAKGEKGGAMGAETLSVATINCAGCATNVPRTAAFCPRCGRPVERTVVNLAKVPTPIPRFGLVFISAAVLGPVLAGLGLLWSIGALLYLGLAVTAVVVVLLVLGLIAS